MDSYYTYGSSTFIKDQKCSLESDKTKTTCESTAECKGLRICAKNNKKQLWEC